MNEISSKTNRYKKYAVVCMILGGLIFMSNSTFLWVVGFLDMGGELEALSEEMKGFAAFFTRNLRIYFALISFFGLILAVSGVFLFKKRHASKLWIIISILVLLVLIFLFLFAFTAAVGDEEIKKTLILGSAIFMFIIVFPTSIFISKIMKLTFP